MKQWIGFLFFIFIFIVPICHSQVNEDLVLTDKDRFDNLRCGMSKEELETMANIKLKSDKILGDFYTLNYSLYGMLSMAGFRFKQNKLNSSHFYAWTTDKNASELVKDYFRIKKILEDEYGDYYYNGTSWKVKKDNPTLEEYAKALENENVDLHFIWRTKKMEINYSLYKDSHDPLIPYNMHTNFICDDDE